MADTGRPRPIDSGGKNVRWASSHDSTRAAVAANHYAPPGLREKVASLIDAAGKTDTLTIDDLAPMDQFHVLREEPVQRLGEKARIDESTRVLDVACGMGGPARYLAQHFGCHVTGIEYSEEFVATARYLCELTHLDDRVEIVHGDATNLPFEDKRFDVTWTQHAQLNIADKRGFFGEMYRVLKPGGVCVMHDLYGEDDRVHFPSYWAKTAADSFLITLEVTQSLIKECGFRITEWDDKTQAFLDWARAGIAEVPQTLDDEQAHEQVGIPGLDQTLMLPDVFQYLVWSIDDAETGAFGVFEALLERPTEGE